MNLLFIQGGSRWKFDTEGNVYTDSNFNNNVWNRYLKHCDKLTVILRREERIYTFEEASKRFNKFNYKKINFVSLPDIYKPVWNVVNFKNRRIIEKTIAREVKLADAIVIRSLGNIYTNTALKYSQRYGKKYLVEVTGFAKESLWYHSLHGKFVANYKDSQYKRLMSSVDYGVYVTQEALQRRYPCRKEALGCSDVEIKLPSDEVLSKRLSRLDSIKNREFVIGTAAFLDVQWKGQRNVLKAIAKLDKLGIKNIRYQMIGAGTGEKLVDLAKKLNISDRVSILGSMPHEKVFEWMDGIDIYVQPSYMEGLCRSIVEAMSRACPVICSNVGGNYELVKSEYLYEAKDYEELASKLLWLIEDKEQLKLASKINFSKSKMFEAEDLNYKREVFYRKVLES